MCRLVFSVCSLYICALCSLMQKVRFSDLPCALAGLYSKCTIIAVCVCVCHESTWDPTWPD